MNPKKLGKLNNHDQPWKARWSVYRDLHFKRFGKERPDTIQTIE